MTTRPPDRRLSDPQPTDHPPADPQLSDAQLSDAQLWRAVDVFRALAWCFAVGTFLTEQEWYRTVWAGGALLGVLALWTVAMAGLPVASRADRRWLAADLAVTVAAVLGSALVQTPEGVDAGAHTVPTIWAAAPVLAWAVARGWRAGLLAAAAVSAADLVLVGTPNGGTVYAIVLLLLAGSVIGYAVQVLREGRRELARAAALEAARHERERLARDIHDGVLQVLAYVSRRGAEVGGEAAELARLAGEQEARLRTLVARAPVDVEAEAASGVRDVGAQVAAMAGDGVDVSAPAGPVPLPTGDAAALLAAAGEALANVRRHAGPGARIWLFLEDEPERVTLTVRDDGVGFSPRRLDDAAAEGRLGVAQSIRGRMEAVGGRVVIDSGPGRGTEVELSVPRVGPGDGPTKVVRTKGGQR